MHSIACVRKSLVTYTGELPLPYTALCVWRTSQELCSWLDVQARVKGRLGQSQVAHYNLDRLGVQTALHLPSTESTPGSSGNISRYQTLQDTMPDMPDDVKQRLASLLAAEFSKKVHSCSWFVLSMS